MYWLAGIITISMLGLVGLGIWFEFNPTNNGGRARRWLKGGLGLNLLVFAAAEIGILLIGVGDVMAATPDTGAGLEVTVGLGLSLIGIGIPTALATIGAGIAVGPIGAASLAVISEKPELFGRSLIYLGLAEGIAIYGLVVTILMLGKIG